MSFFLFKTSDHGRSRPDIILDCLSRAAKRGVTVKVVLDIDNDSTSTISGNNKETAERLKKGGIDVCYDSLGTTTHTKVAVFDGRYTVLGSHNLTSSALKYNHEISIFVDSPEIAKETLGYINSLCD
jgi:phosphatidylserine/phosphatidylglycerophosphate/cardiolipin synthase-like enzyme